MSFQNKGTVNAENEDEEDDEEEELGHTDTYAEYVPSKCKYYFILFLDWINFFFWSIEIDMVTYYLHCTSSVAK